MALTWGDGGPPKIAGGFLETGKSQSKMDENWGYTSHQSDVSWGRFLFFLMTDLPHYSGAGWSQQKSLKGKEDLPGVVIGFV